MKTIYCQGCASSVPMNDSVRIHERALCIPCAEKEVAASPVPKEAISHIPDPTVCTKCGADGGERILPLVAQVPVCQKCESGLRERPFPAWVKLGFAATLSLVFVGLYVNYRFLAGHLEMLRSAKAIRAGQWDRAVVLADAAARHVPESQEFD